MKLRKAFAERLKQLREAAGLSQEEVATRADMSLSLVAKMEQGKKGDLRVRTVLALAAALQVRPGELLDDLPLKSAVPQAEPSAHETCDAPSVEVNGVKKGNKKQKKGPERKVKI